ncbi:MAG: haloacid dehalogenase-like hydrolase, partial [Acetobacteraceae bacterium]
MIERRSLAALFLALPVAAQAQSADPLPSWREGPRKRALLDFVAAVTREGGSGFVPPAERIAVFDNDGTLWVEQPAYPQLIFI